MSELSWPAIVRLVHARARHCCEYCQTSQATIGQALHVEHIDPRGGNAPTNLCLAPQRLLDPFLVFKQTPRNLLEPSRTFRNLLESPYKHSGTFPNLENDPQYTNLILRTISDLLVMSRIQSETPNNIRSPTHIPYLLKNNFEP